MKRKIAILTLHPHNYGGVLSLMQAFWRFAEKHFEPKLFYLSYDTDVAAHFKQGRFFAATKEEKLFGMQGTAVGVWLSRWEPGHYWFNYRQWTHALKDYEYCVVVSGNPIAAHPLTYLRKKFIIWAATPFEDDRVQRAQQLTGFAHATHQLSAYAVKNIERQVLRSASQVFGLSQYATDRFNEIAGSGKAMVCGYPMELQSYVEGNRPPILMAAGRWTDPRKNLTMLLNSFSMIYQQRPDAQLHVFGQKPNAVPPLDEHPSMRHVTFHGYADRELVDAMYRQAQLFLIPSHQEGFGIVGLEAFSHGVPVISTACGGPQDFVRNDQNGYLVAVDDAAMMAQRSLEVLNSRSLQQQLARGARMMIEQQFLPSIINNQLAQALMATYPELSLVLE